MLAHFHFSHRAFERLLKLQLLSRFQPIDEPIVRNGQPCYLDGIEIVRADFLESPRTFAFGLNRVRPNGKVGPVSQNTVSFAPMMISVGARILMSPLSSVKA